MRTCVLAFQLILVASLSFSQTPASPVAGSWEGAIDAGAVKLRIGVVITVKPDGMLSATMDSPDQGAFDLPLGDVTFADGVLKFALRAGERRVRGTRERRRHRDRGNLDARDGDCPSS